MEDSKYIEILEELVSSMFQVNINDNSLMINHHNVLAGKSFKNNLRDQMQAVARAQLSHLKRIK